MQGASRRHYLDHASTTPLRRSAALAVASWAQSAGRGGGVGDPGRVHAEGQAARAALEDARERVASLLRCAAARVVFTSGATEAANTAVLSAAAERPGQPIVAAGVEHSCVLQAARRAGVLLDLAVGTHGTVDLGRLEELLAGPELPALVNCQWANHEVGTVQPVTEAILLCRERGVPVHVDAACAVGHVPVDLSVLDADFVSVSSHKLGGPPGIGALVVRRGVRLRPLLVGGAEERGRRAGGENVLGAVGFGAAAEELATSGTLAREMEEATRATGRILEAAAAMGGVMVLGERQPAGRLPHIVCFGIDGVLGEGVLIALDRAGISVHSGSACSSEVLEPSPVLAAMGADPDSSLRVSVGWSTTDDDVDALVSELPRVVARLRSLGKGRTGPRQAG